MLLHVCLFTCLRVKEKPLSTLYLPGNQNLLEQVKQAETIHTVELQAHFPLKTHKSKFNVQAELKGLCFSGKLQGAMSNCCISLNIMHFYVSTE